ncbi:hypothetical protein HDU93_001081 [Gonapodya sp. JEL0774]|nr:hypothetical protein HDU93_001081 [Gonapodya sp. JEL0774]
MSQSTRPVSGIATRTDGERVIPQSRRPDGTVRPERRVRDGYTPPEDVTRYKNARAESARLPAGYVVGLGVVSKEKEGPKTKAAKKNERRKARRKDGNEDDADGKEDDEVEPMPNDGNVGQSSAPTNTPGKAVLSPAPPSVIASTSQPSSSTTPDSQTTSSSSHAELEKKVRALKKKLRQAQELQEKSAGSDLATEQKEKVRKIPEMQKELNDLEAAMSKLVV